MSSVTFAKETPRLAKEDSLNEGPIAAQDRLILALDFPADPQNRERLIEAEDAFRLVEQLGDLVRIVKVGWPLYMVGGNEVIRKLTAQGKRVFLDLKFGDIAETVKRFVAVALREHVAFLTVNASFQAVRAAVQSRGSGDLKILTITLLTSLDETDLKELGISVTVPEYVLYKTRGAKESGCDGVVASGREVAAIRKELGDDFLVVTPGIRPRGATTDDHKRAVTPEASIRDGADYLVVGRPITKADDPRAATSSILEEMQRAFDRYRR